MIKIYKLLYKTKILTKEMIVNSNLKANSFTINFKKILN